jgi:hypothetical protein
MNQPGSWRWQRIALKATALLLLGTFSTAFTAVVAAYLPDDREYKELGWASRSISFGSTRYSTKTSLAKGPREGEELAAIADRLPSTRFKDRLPQLDPSIRVSYAPIPDQCFVRGEHWGVPLRAFEGWRGVRPNGQTVVFGDITQLFVNDRGLALVLNNHRVVPIIPLCSGFAMNTFVYAFLWFFALLMTARFRRSLRRRRGLCPACAYDLHATSAGSPCPECGARIAMP